MPTSPPLSVKDDVTPRELDVKKLRARLIEMGIPLDRDPAFGQGYVRANAKIDADDLLYPEQNASGQATVVLKKDRKSKYVLDHRKIEEEEMDKYLHRTGYTDNGGDVGTNLE